MQAMTSSMMSMYRQQIDAMQSLASASLSGFERAQQSALEIYKQALAQQLDVFGRVNEHTAQAVLDPQQARPALEGMIRAQREMVQAMSETQRRLVDSLSMNGDAHGGGELASGYIDSVRRSIEQWQQFAQQMFDVAREQAEQMGGDLQRRGDAAAGAMHRGADQVQDASRRVAEAARKHAEQQSHKARATESA